MVRQAHHEEFGQGAILSPSWSGAVRAIHRPFIKTSEPVALMDHPDLRQKARPDDDEWGGAHHEEFGWRFFFSVMARLVRAIHRPSIKTSEPVALMDHPDLRQ